jgi:signal peptidase II
MNKRLIPYIFLTISAAILDIVTKLVVQANLKLGQSVPVIEDFFHLTYVLNQGGAFGSRLGSNVFYLVSALIVIGLVIFFLYREFGKNSYVDFALFLILGGAVGNLFDRIRMGAVVDFLDFDFFKINFFGYQFDRWPTFNIADAEVTVGIAILLLTFLFGLGRQVESERDNHDSNNMESGADLS